MKCIFLSTTRNTGNYLDSIFKNINLLKEKVFSELAVCFFYDNSTDNTLEKLQEFKNIYGDKFHIIVNTEPLLQYRTHRLALARNKLVEFVKNNYSDYEYFIMMDSDYICGYEINTNVLHEALVLDTWDSLSFNRSGIDQAANYDIWALQYEPFIHHCHSYTGGVHDVIIIMRHDITQKLNSLKDWELFECYSAFNGFAIYRTNKFLNAIYDGETQLHFPIERVNNMLNLFKQKYNLNITINYDYVSMVHGGGKQNCEHIAFHLDAIRKNNARIRITGKRIFTSKHF
jgi:hypothetical protein